MKVSSRQWIRTCEGINVEAGKNENAQNVTNFLTMWRLWWRENKKQNPNVVPVSFSHAFLMMMFREEEEQEKQRSLVGGDKKAFLHTHLTGDGGTRVLAEQEKMATWGENKQRISLCVGHLVDLWREEFKDACCCPYYINLSLLPKIHTLTFVKFGKKVKHDFWVLGQMPLGEIQSVPFG